MRISHSRKFVFVHKYKCAGTSIASAIDRYSEIKSWYLSPYYHHEPLATIEAHFDAMGWDFSAYTVFTSVRHPVTMLASLYKWGFPDQDGSHWWERRWDDLLAGTAIARDDRQAANPIGFRDWLMTFDLSEFALDRYVFGREGLRRADIVLRFETLDADFAALIDRLGLPPTELPRLKIGNSIPPEFDSEMLARVRAVFKTDIALGGYAL